MNPVQNGTHPYRPPKSDYDYIPTFHPQVYAGVVYPEFPAEFLTDNTGWFPDQNADGQPNGCTNYSTTKLAKILGFADATVQMIENITHANAKGGFGVIDSVDAARKTLGWFKWRFILQSKGRLDWFSALQLMQVEALGLREQRAISIGVPWFHSWQSSLSGSVRQPDGSYTITVGPKNKILPMPSPEELKQVHDDPNSIGWHDVVADGWTSSFSGAPGQLLYRIESHQGHGIDYIYIPRDVMNVVMDLYGTVAVTGTNLEAPKIASIPLPDWFWSLCHSWFGFSY